MQFFNDALSFAGPLLLNLLVGYLNDSSSSDRSSSSPPGAPPSPLAPGPASQSSSGQVVGATWPQLPPQLLAAWQALLALLSRDSPWFPVTCAALLALSALLKALLNTHYNYQLVSDRQGQS